RSTPDDFESYKGLMTRAKFVIKRSQLVPSGPFDHKLRPGHQSLIRLKVVRGPDYGTGKRRRSSEQQCTKLVSARRRQWHYGQLRPIVKKRSLPSITWTSSSTHDQ